MKRRVVAICALALSASFSAADAQRARVAAASCGKSGQSTAPHLKWQGTTVQWAEWPVALGARRIPARFTVVALNPRHVRLSLDIVRDGAALLPWTIGNAGSDAVVAVNAGQFTDAGPWGWVVHNGREHQSPGSGSLAGALVLDTSGAASIVDAANIHSVRGRPHVVEAVQSFPVLLNGHAHVPMALCSDSVDATHRDRRLAIGIRSDGVLLIVLSRYDGAGNAGERLPIGPTTLEMASAMQLLGAHQAIMLDGGLSAQLLVRSGSNSHEWPGLRGVPMGLVGRLSATPNEQQRD